MLSIPDAARSLRNGTTTASALIEDALARIATDDAVFMPCRRDGGHRPGRSCGH